MQNSAPLCLSRLPDKVIHAEKMRRTLLSLALTGILLASGVSALRPSQKPSRKPTPSRTPSRTSTPSLTASPSHSHSPSASPSPSPSPSPPSPSPEYGEVWSAFFAFNNSNQCGSPIPDSVPSDFWVARWAPSQSGMYQISQPYNWPTLQPIHSKTLTFGGSRMAVDRATRVSACRRVCQRRFELSASSDSCRRACG